MGPNHWRTSDKRIIRIIDMDDKHLINCIKMLRRNYSWLLYSPERTINVVFPKFKHLMSEAMDRKLLTDEAHYVKLIS